MENESPAYLRWSDPRLATSAAPLASADPPAREMARKLMDHCHTHGLEALAGPQLGMMRRVCVLAPDAGLAPMELYHPRTIWRSHDQLPDQYIAREFGVDVSIMRSSAIRISWMDDNSNPHERLFTGKRALLLGRMMDYLDGISLLSHLPAADGEAILRKASTRS